ncbi:MAG: DNA-processing protein DprA [Anaerolineae bacterium]|jgi:DNA processing protein|nr:DNA-protecting protein DprA [Chloroflexota bacterium]
MEANLARYWIGFQRVPGIGPARLKGLVESFGDAEAAWFASAASLRAAGLSPSVIEQLLSLRGALDLDAEWARVERLGVRVLTWQSPEYPRLLREIDQAPAVLYLLGELEPVDELAVAVVGTRSPSSYGKAVTEQLAVGLAANGVTVVSGLALGIDGIAHRAALDAGGRTLAVLGNGLDTIYPARHRSLAERIQGEGALLSDYPLGTRPEAHNFPARNRIISGLTLGTVVVEADRQSGALITLRYALDQGRETYAVPGNVLARTSLGTNEAIQRGEAKLVTGVEDILSELNLSMIVEQRTVAEQVPGNANEALLLQAIGSDAVHVDELARSTGMGSGDVMSTLLMLELKGMVRAVDGMTYVANG